MRNILDNILALKKKEVEKLKFAFDLDFFRTISPDFDRTCFSLKQSLAQADNTGIIAEFKRKSPSKGWFKTASQSAPLIVGSYDDYGAAGASILTDREYFGGEMEDLLVVRRITNLPLLRKDFIIDEIQLQEAKAYGADVILLIAAMLTRQRTIALTKAAKEYGLEVLLEIHDETELDHICEGVDIVGVNNRNLKTFETDVDVSFRLIDKIPGDKIAISESGISDIETICALRAAGYRGFLIGETFMKEDDPAFAFKSFAHQLKAVS